MLKKQDLGAISLEIKCFKSYFPSSISC